MGSLTWRKVALLGALGVALYALATLDIQPQSAGAAPLAQVTATPGPAVASLGGVPIYAPHAPNGNNLLGVSCENGCSASGGGVGVGTPQPVYPVGAPAVQTPVSVSLTNIPTPGPTLAAVALNAGEAHIGAIGGNTTCVTTEKTRPANTTAYVANDAWAESTSAATVWTWTNLARVSGGTGTLNNVTVTTDNTANTTRFEIELYGVTTITAINDHVEATLLYANAANYLGKVTMPALVKPTTNSTAAAAYNADVRIPIKLTSTANLTGIVRVLDAYTPTSGAKLSIQMCMAQD